MKGLFVTATDTNVGKTWLGSQLLAELKRQNIQIQVRKPVESGWSSETQINTTDAWKLADAVGQTDALEIICPNRFSAALSPDRAAMLEAENLTLEQLKGDCLKGIGTDDFLYVEGAGGFYSPICDNGLNADLAIALNLPILLVVENRLGCINQTLLNVEAISKRGLPLKAIVLNTPKPIEDDQRMDNFSDIQKRVDCTMIAFGFEQTQNDSITQLAALVRDQ